MQIGLESYSYSFSSGMSHQKAQPEGFVPLTASDLMEKAKALGLDGISLDLNHFVDAGDKSALHRLRSEAERRSMFLNGAAGGTDPDRLVPLLKAGAALGCRLLRTVVGGANLGGDRTPLRRKWPGFMAETTQRLQRLAAEAEKHRVVLGIENHQDLTSDELVSIMRSVSSPWLGIVLDVANPLGTGEEPDTFYRKVLPYVCGAHLKDYRVVPTSSGYRLCRCALGDGVVDFPSVLKTLDRWHPQIQPTVELAALEARHVRLLEEDFWHDYPERPARELARTWRFVKDHAADPAWDWRTPLERGLFAQSILGYEDEQVKESVAYLRSLAVPEGSGDDPTDAGGV